MTAPIDRVNRTLLALLGLLLTVAGLVGLALGFEVFGARRSEGSMLPGRLERFFQDHGWAWLLVALAALVVALLALRWLLAQLHRQRVTEIPLERHQGSGATRLRAGAVTDALCQEVEGYRGVERADGRLIRDPQRPDLLLRVDLNERADIAALRRRIEGGAVAHARQALGVETLPTRLELRVARPPSRQLQ